MKKSILIIAALFLILLGRAAEGDTAKILGPSKYPDELYVKENARNRKPVPYTSLREADVMWSKRVWRVIDLREKMNLPLYYPDSRILGRKSLFDVITDEALLTGKITCFDNPATDDQFRYEMTATELSKKLIS